MSSSLIVRNAVLPQKMPRSELVLIFIVSVVSLVQGEETGNSLVNCAACQSLQAQIDHWSCDVNCKVINSQNGKL